MNGDWRVFEFEEGQSVEGAEGGEGAEKGEGGGAGQEGVRLREWEGMETGGMGWSWDKVVPLGNGLPDADGVVRGGAAV